MKGAHEVAVKTPVLVHFLGTMLRNAVARSYTVSFCKDQPGCFPESLCCLSFIPTSSMGFPTSPAFGAGR